MNTALVVVLLTTRIYKFKEAVGMASYFHYIARVSVIRKLSGLERGEENNLGYVYYTVKHVSDSYMSRNTPIIKVLEQEAAIM
jgi:hypothetical protein